MSAAVGWLWDGLAAIGLLSVLTMAALQLWVVLHKPRGLVHGKALDDTRLCRDRRPGELATTFWMLVTCPRCQREVERRKRVS